MLNVLSWLLKSNVFKKKPTQLVEVVDHCAATKKIQDEHETASGAIMKAVPEKKEGRNKKARKEGRREEDNDGGERNKGEEREGEKRKH